MWPSPDPVRTAAVNVADAVFPYDYRGVRPALARLPADAYARAALELLDRRPGVVVLITGFPVNGIAETDGPPGAAAVGRALRALSWHVVTVVDPMTRPVIEALGQDLGEIEEVDADGVAQAEVATGRLLDRIRPHAAIAIERPGLTADGRLANMRGETLDPSPVPLDGLMRVPISIGVGDGGNELGMGSLASFMRRRGISPAPCVTRARHVLLASVSNWGAYGLTTLLEMLADRPLMPSEADDRRWMRAIVSAGAVDGITARSEPTVDTFAYDRTAQVLHRLADACKTFALAKGQVPA
ncbi:MAG: DUF4392 domain-containing protein [Chloroflexi bacterium]|nr:DUF4392 domain-containing protein [Chloroflexota bacterium]